MRVSVRVLAALTSGVLAACGGNENTSPLDSGPQVDSNSAGAIRAFIGAQIPGGVDKLKVPATDSAIPVPPAPAAYPGRFDVTEPKRYLGKRLFHDPVRTQRVNVNQGQ